MKFTATAPAKFQNGQFPAPAKFGHSRPRPNPTPGRLLLIKGGVLLFSIEWSSSLYTPTDKFAVHCNFVQEISQQY
jgi:hypothetical protein